MALSGDRNVLLVTIDTLRSGALGFESGPARTPNLDRLAARGTTFAFAHAHAVVTLPSHASILTGVYPFQHGYRDNSGYRLAPGTRTLAGRLRQSGFATAAFVSAFPLDARFGLTDGFDTYDGRFDDTETGARFVIPERAAPAVVAPAVEWIAAQKGRWFTWVHVYEPHAPYTPPPPFDREYAAQPYYGEVSAVDAALGPLFDAAARTTRPTLVVVTSDHGESLGEHGEETHGLFAYESTLHVPLIVAELEREASLEREALAERTVANPARHIDIVPTILDALDLPPAPELPGRSLRTAADRAAERASYFEAMSGSLEYGWAPLNGVLAGRDKYINLPIPELYDLSSDRSEERNRAAGDSERARTLAGRLAQFGATPPSAPAAETADVAARLRSLGYTASGNAKRSAVTEADDPKRLVHLDRRMHEAALLERRGQFAEAAAVYRQILAERPEMVGAARHLAFVQWRVADAGGAIDTLTRALRTAGSAAAVPGVSVQLAGYLVETGRAQQAIALLQQAVAIEPGFDALNALGLALARAGRAAEARAAFERALQVDPNSATVFENVGAVALDAGQLAEARRAFERAIALDERSAQAHNGVAMVAARSGDRKTAIAHWRRGVELQPDAFDALYDLGMTLAQDGQTSEARRYLEQFARSAPPQQYAKELRNVEALLGR